MAAFEGDVVRAFELETLRPKRKVSDLNSCAGWAADARAAVREQRREAPDGRHQPAPTRTRRGAGSGAYLWQVVTMDLLAGVLAASVATALGPQADVRPGYWIVSLAVVVAWPALIAVNHGYDVRYLGVTVDEYRAVGRSVIGLTGLVGVAGVVLTAAMSRGYLLVLLPILFALSNCGRLINRAWLRHQRSQGALMQRTVVVGGRDAVARLIRTLKDSPNQGLLPVGACTSTTGWGGEAEWVEGVPVVGSPEQAVAVLEPLDAEAVVVTSDLHGQQLRRLAWALESYNVDLLVSTGLLDVAGPRLTIRPSEETALLHIERPAASRAHVLVKGAMDRALALVLICVLSPVLLAVAVSIKLNSPGPVMFRQTRIGMRGKPFRIFKFRTMVVHAEKHLDELRHLSEGNEVQFKMRRDPRVTTPGAFLRRYSLDELPQLLNVVLGNMSLVGPRPQSQRELDQYDSDAMRRLVVRPGMTGLWQVSGRSDLSWEQSLRLDLRYVDNWSPIVDLRILLRTFRAVSTGAGAY